VAFLLPIAFTGAVVLSGCHGTSSAAPPAPAPRETTVAASTTTTSTLPPTTVYQPSAPQPSQDDAGTHLVDAWMAGDRAAALTDATPAAVAALFAQPFPSGGIQARGCSSAVAGPSSCVYRIYDNGNLVDLSAMMVTGGWMISAARFES
jgi:hypothetical protein